MFPSLLQYEVQYSVRLASLHCTAFSPAAPLGIVRSTNLECSPIAIGAPSYLSSKLSSSVSRTVLPKLLIVRYRRYSERYGPRKAFPLAPAPTQHRPQTAKTNLALTRHSIHQSINHLTYTPHLWHAPVPQTA